MNFAVYDSNLIGALIRNSALGGKGKRKSYDRSTLHCCSLPCCVVLNCILAWISKDNIWFSFNYKYLKLYPKKNIAYLWFRDLWVENPKNYFEPIFENYENI